MSLASRSLASRLGLLAARSLLLWGLPVVGFPDMAVPAQAHELEVEVGTSLICDTQAQVEQFVALYDGDAQSAVDTVNAAEHNPMACAVTTIAFVRGPQLATARGKETSFLPKPGSHPCRPPRSSRCSPSKKSACSANILSSHQNDSRRALAARSPLQPP